MDAKTQTFLDYVNSGKRDTDKAKVYFWILHCKLTDIRQISLNARLPEKTVSGRLSELMEMGVIKVFDTFQEGKSTFSMYISQTDPIKIQQNADTVRKKKLIKWAKKGLNDFRGHLDLGVQAQLSEIIGSND